MARLRYRKSVMYRYKVLTNLLNMFHISPCKNTNESRKRAITILNFEIALIPLFTPNEAETKDILLTRIRIKMVPFKFKSSSGMRWFKPPLI